VCNKAFHIEYKPMSKLAVVDLETTGMDPTRDRITEMAVIQLDDGVEVGRWQSLVNPQVGIPAEIQAITGITPSMVRGAPTFEALAATLLEKIQGRIFVAHNARFDYGFIKQSFARVNQTFTADVLCSVRLSRRLEPEHASHSLDSLMQRHRLHTEYRHRAMGDAELVVQLFQVLQGRHGSEAFVAAQRRILKTPSLPPHLAPDALDAIPDAPGVYVFYGVNDQPLYIGKSVNLRERVRSHFSNDYRNANDTRLSAEMRRIEVHPCAGEFGALLLESKWIRERFPALNKALRKNDLWVVMDKNAQIIPVTQLTPAQLPGHFGPYSTKRSAKTVLEGLSTERQLCWAKLALEKKREGACFGFQVKKCAGLCVGLETEALHQERLEQGLAQWEIPGFAFSQGGYVYEHSVLTGARYHVFYDWCYAGTFETPSAIPVQPPEKLVFEPTVFRLLTKADLLPLSALKT
jgi:DNA polymerase III subunit epsilon